jgi:glucose/arabinose dehydrogenase
MRTGWEEACMAAQYPGANDRNAMAMRYTAAMTTLPAIACAAATLLALALATGSGGAQVLPDGFTDQEVVGALRQPTAFDFLPDGRVLFVEQATARVRMVRAGAIGPTDPVLTVPGTTTGAERGLLGIAVDPRWPAAPYVYVHATATPARIRVSRFTANGDLDGSGDGAIVLDPDSRHDLVDDVRDEQFNHNGGTVRFGPDGLLYASFGEDAVPCDAQVPGALRGVLLRLDVTRVPPGPGSAPRALVIPPDNPFTAGADSNAALVAAFGLRNPFRFQVDPVRRWLIVGDVGQTQWEELDLLRLPGASPGPVATLGADFGWPYREGPALLSDCGPEPAPLVDPVYAYDRSAAAAASVIAGPAYRAAPGAAGNWPAEYEGEILMSDYYSGVLRRLRPAGEGLEVVAPVAGQPNATDWAVGFRAAVDYRVGPDGAVWYLRQSVNFADRTGSLRRIVYTGGEPPPPPGTAVQVVLTSAPQPAPGSVTLRFTPSAPVVVTLRVHDATGRAVRTLLAGSARDAAAHDVLWDGRDDAGEPVPAGVYHARLEGGGAARSQRVVLLR